MASKERVHASKEEAERSVSSKLPFFIPLYEYCYKVPMSKRSVTGLHASVMCAYAEEHLGFHTWHRTIRLSLSEKIRLTSLGSFWLCIGETLAAAHACACPSPMQEFCLSPAYARHLIIAGWPQSSAMSYHNALHSGIGTWVLHSHPSLQM